MTSTAAYGDTAPQLDATCDKPNIKGGPINCSECNDVSVHISIDPRDLSVVIILEPSCILKDPAVFVLVGDHVDVSSCEEKRKNKSSCVVVLPIVVSVPINIACLSGVDKIKCLDAVGAFACTTAARVVTPPDLSHLNNLPLLCSASKSSPKFSNTQYLESRTVVEDDAASFQLVALISVFDASNIIVTVALSACVVAS